MRRFQQWWVTRSERRARPVSAPTVMMQPSDEKDEQDELSRSSEELPRFQTRPMSMSEPALDDSNRLTKTQLHQFWMVACVICRWPRTYHLKMLRCLDFSEGVSTAEASDTSSRVLTVEKVGRRAMQRCRRRHMVASMELVLAAFSEVMRFIECDSERFGGMHAQALMTLRSCLHRMAQQQGLRSWVDYPRPKAASEIASDIRRYIDEYSDEHDQAFPTVYIENKKRGLYYMVLNSNLSLNRKIDASNRWTDVECENVWVLDLLLLVCMTAKQFVMLYRDGVYDSIDETVSVKKGLSTKQTFVDESTVSQSKNRRQKQSGGAVFFVSSEKKASSDKENHPVEQRGGVIIKGNFS